MIMINISNQLLTIIRAEKFDVALPFVLQQAAWLYERQLSQVKAHMRRVGASKASAHSPVPGTDSAAEEAIRRTGSGGGGINSPRDCCSSTDIYRPSTRFVSDRPQRLSHP